MPAHRPRCFGNGRMAMSTSNSVLQIIEANLEQVKSAVAAEFRKSQCPSFQNLDDETLKIIAWSHLDPIIQSLRYEDDFLFTFFLDHASGRSAEEGLPIEDSLLTLNVISRALLELTIRKSDPGVLPENLLRLDRILSKGKDGIAANYLRQRDFLLEELRKSNTKLMDVTKRKLDFLAKVSHELKTPLTSVIAYSEQLRSSDLPEEIRNEFIGVICDQSSKLYQLIEDLLDLSKAENEASRLNLSWADVQAVLRDAVATVKARAAEKNINLVLLANEALPKVYMDPFRIQQVVWNLLTNGVKYNREGGRVTVSTERRDGNLVVKVSDNGIGVKPENLKRIFDSFCQTQDAMAMLEGGAGLGLDIARHYIQLHGGEIWVESEFGVGSDFYFSLPIYGPKQQGRNTEEPTDQDSAAASLPRPKMKSLQR